MRKIKVLAMGLVLALAGFVYAAGQAQDSKNACSMDKASMSCCADCCKSEDSSCKMHKMHSKHANAQQVAQHKHDCCASGECCKGKSSCCTADKSGKNHAKTKACEMKKDGASSCCTSGEGGCCGKACCTKGESKAS